MPSTLVYTLACAVPALLALRLATRPRPASLPLPPGPRGLPLIGNALDLTAHELWLRAAEWAREFGGITYLNVCGLSLVFVNTPEAAAELLERKGALYADRMHMNMLDLSGCSNMVAFTPYGPQMRRQRRLMQRALGPAAIPAYRPLMVTETRALLRRLAATPDAWRAHVGRYGGSLTLRVMYGYSPAEDDDEFLALAGECVDLLSNKIASTANVWPVDLFPALKALPEWAPGAGFKRSARAWKARMEHFVDAPFAWTRAQIAAGSAVPSFVSTILADGDGKALPAQDAHDLKWTANSMYSASLDTTATTVAALLLALLDNPAALARAQAELDAVVGPGRLPSFADRAALPYLDALLSEGLRHGVPVPLGLPHRLAEDDVYAGARIPKGALVFGNAWAMSRNAASYPAPESFSPERFLGPTPAPDPRAYAFGFGRRRCPGAHLVEDSLWLLLAGLVHAFDVTPERDDDGGEVGRAVRYDNPVFRTPSEFPVVLSVRPGRDALLADEL